MAMPSTAECLVGLPPLGQAKKGCEQAIEEDLGEPSFAGNDFPSSPKDRSGMFGFIEADDLPLPSTTPCQDLDEPSFTSNDFPSLPQDEFFKVVPTTLHMMLPEEGPAPLLGNDFLHSWTRRWTRAS
jgi:hypothetical protein